MTEESNERNKSFSRSVVIILAVVATTTIVTHLGVRSANEPPSSLRRQREGRRQLHLDPRTVELKLDQTQNWIAKSDSSVITTINVYNQTSIEETAKHFTGSFVPRILVFDGETFQFFNLQHKSISYPRVYNDRAMKAVPLLVGALKNIAPDRFKKNAPPFQLVYADGDSVQSDCFQDECNTNQFAPLLAFGSVPRDKTIFSNLQVFPVKAYIFSCLYDWKMNEEKYPSCTNWLEQLEYDQEVDFHSLTPQIIWRGANHGFLMDQTQFRKSNRVFFMSKDSAYFGEDSNDSKESTYERFMKLKQLRWDEVTPRWRGVLLTVEEELRRQEEPLSSSKSLPWINVKFPKSKDDKRLDAFLERGFPVTGDTIEADAQSRYKYLIDFGGGGGTTWRGTLTKLKMPGLLFHHSTPFVDWFYEDYLQDRVNCLFVNWDLSNLKEQYDWAESHPEEAKRIAEQGTKLATYLFSSAYMSKLYDNLFVNYLKEVVNAYKEDETMENSNWESMKSQYEQNGFQLTQITTCDDFDCVTDMGEGWKPKFTYISKKRS